MRVFVTGFVQVFLIAINTYLISKEFVVGVFVSTFGINILWTYNVKSVSIGDLRTRLMYSFGASSGAVVGLTLAKQII